MAGKRLHVRDHQRGLALHGRAADAATDRDAHARDLPLEGTENETRPAHEIKSGPVQIRNEIEDQRRHIGRIGDGIGLALEERG